MPRPHVSVQLIRQGIRIFFNPLYINTRRVDGNIFESRRKSCGFKNIQIRVDSSSVMLRNASTALNAKVSGLIQFSPVEEPTFIIDFFFNI